MATHEVDKKNNDGSPLSTVIRTHGLMAECTGGQRPSGEWFMMGSVRDEGGHILQRPPAWILVATGASQDDAINGLISTLAAEAVRLSAV